MLLAAGLAFLFDAVILLIFGEKQRGVPKIVDGVFNWDFRIIMPYDRILIGFLAVAVIAAFILFMQREDGSFHSKWDEAGGYNLEFVSLYYPGEAILGLVRLYRIDREARWLEVAARAAAYLVESQSSADEVVIDHWLLIAGRDLMSALGELDAPPIDAASLRQHLMRIGWAIAAEFEAIREGGDEQVLGAADRNGKSSPAATRLEGLLALRDVLDPAVEDEALLIAAIDEVLETAIPFLLRCQVREGWAAGGITWGIEGMENHASRRDEIRIDYVQHALSALIDYAWVIEESSAP